MSNDKPLVSIFVISYNGKDFLRQAIESFLAQTYGNIEICVSDDGSTDGTREILLEYKTQLGERFKYNINEKNLGITKNSNKCLELCNGEYIAYCGGDDLFLPEKIEKQVNLMMTYKDASACFSDAEIFDSISNRCISLLSMQNKKYLQFKSDVRDVIMKGCFFGACTVMVRTTQIHKFDERLIVASDWFQIVQILNKSKGQLYYIDEVLSRYRRHDKNITNHPENKISQGEIDYIIAYNILLITYPKYYKYIKTGLAARYRVLGRYINPFYYWLAFKTNPFEYKNLISLLLAKLKGKIT